MEILGLGSSIVECVRIARMIERYGEQFLNRVFTLNEMRACRATRDTTENFTAFWASKEAIFKSLGLIQGKSRNWLEVEIQLSERREPFVFFGGNIKELLKQQEIHDVRLTMSYCRSFATATAIAVRRGEKQK